MFCCTLPTILRPGGPVPIFGEGCGYIDTRDVTTNTTTSYVPHLTLAKNMGAALYFVEFHCIYGETVDDAAGSCDVRYTIDGVDVFSELGNTAGQGIADFETPGNMFASSFVVDLPSGVHTFELDCRVDPITGGPGDEVNLYWAGIALFSYGVAP